MHDLDFFQSVIFINHQFQFFYNAVPIPLRLSIVSLLKKIENNRRIWTACLPYFTFCLS